MWLSGQIIDGAQSILNAHSYSIISRASTRSLGIGLSRTSWVKLNCMWTGIGHFYSSMYKQGLAPSPNCKCGANNQTADHIILMCLIH